MINLYQVDGSSSWRMIPFCGFGVDFFSWQFGHSAVALVRSAVMSESPRVTSIPVAMVTLFVGPLGKDRSDWGKRMTIHRMDHLIHLIMNILLYLCCNLLSISWGANIFIL